VPSDLGFNRFVALGDSTTEGLDDPYPVVGDGPVVYRGWADRLAERLAKDNPELRYANLAIRGRLIADIGSGQLDQALAMEPDLVSVVGGVNDLLRPNFELSRVIAELTRIVDACRAAGATVLVMTLPDLSDSMRLARLVSGRLAEFNQAVRGVAETTGATLVDAAEDLATYDPRGWSPDRLHANGVGHEYLMWVAAQALGVEEARQRIAELQASAPEPAELSAFAAARFELGWAWLHLRPWILRRLKGTSSGDGASAKRPALAPVGAPDLAP
jgi:lysophospholipase L1-like esterase